MKELPIESIEYGGYTIKIYPDPDTESPRSWGNLGKISLFHGKYKLPNELERTMEECKRLESNADWLVLPVYILDHSGVTLSTEPFNDPWDSGRVGITAVEKAEALKRMPEETALEIMKREVRTYGQYLNGEVFGYVIEDKNDEEIDACWDFIGYDSVVETAKEYVDDIVKRNNEKNWRSNQHENN